MNAGERERERGREKEETPTRQVDRQRGVAYVVSQLHKEKDRQML